MGKKITQLATITEIADDDLLVGVDISDTSGSDDGTNKKFTKANLLSGLALLTPQQTGWNPDAETWAYHSVDDPTGYIKIEGKDVSANYSVGWRIMFTNGGNVIKGIITAITYSDPDTILTFLHEIDPTDNQALYLLTNSAITENYFSPHKAPLGFPLDPNKWSVKIKDTTSTAQATPTANQWYNIGGVGISIPIGLWKIKYSHLWGLQETSGTTVSGKTTLSTGNTTESDVDFSSYGAYIGATGSITLRILAYREKFVSLVAKTQYYLNTLTAGSGNENLYSYGAILPTKIIAECAYL